MNWTWAASQPLNTLLRRASWLDGSAVKQVSTGKWKFGAGPVSGARYTPNAADYAATDWELYVAPAMGEGG